MKMTSAGSKGLKTLKNRKLTSHTYDETTVTKVVKKYVMLTIRCLINCMAT
jgi:hypothetical protein